MSNETKKPAGWSAEDVLQEMRDWDHAEDWPSDISTLGRWAEVVAAMIAERNALRAALIALRDAGPNGSTGFAGWHPTYKDATDKALKAISLGEAVRADKA